ncbi:MULTISPECIES: carbonic anhydrase family protein [unclassified Tenacibaculum]|uniref:carbonic anhydrase family protein n=1 Tax=unclassified Tenacibaculum TaxID=2635139 RepID=UPI001EEDBC41|nr:MULTISPECIES: carbonic anhydrase family protein [unclassified Tenacibaculum]MCF2875967.1 carbonic anhydrase [Tenacibaculum sp. Cn5-1]MCF2936042.1 carbonic anhydrase [Tenacibaculum sp. Cn5-34]MCG7512603.1 carbonic anhydrase [Tenacibaculum sp. Cn5-46]
MRNVAITKDVQAELTADSVLQDLLDGNKRYTSNNLTASSVTDLVEQTTGGQFPKAVILSCIDSRVPVEMVFDQTIGDVFVARVAGNFENVDILGSMEYSCAVAGSKLVFVLGHESCGAVKAACDGVELGNITAMLDNIVPAAKLASEQVEGEANSTNSAFVAKTVENNVKLTMDRIRQRSKILQEMEDNGEIKIVGGVYSLTTGKVEMI